MKNREDLIQKLKKIRTDYKNKTEEESQLSIAESRYNLAREILGKTTTFRKQQKQPLSDRVDKIVCNKFLGPVILFATLYLVYQLAIVQGYNLTDYWWPVLGWFQDTIESILPKAGFLSMPWITSLVIWVIQGVVAVLNYIPIFLILFALVAIMEDSGYMARIAFILDRVFRPFGLHGQSALPLMLGGLYVGGCAIPGIMAARAIKDKKARLATILVVPLMNCLAKIPFYVLLIDIFFIQYAGFMMFMISTVTIFTALIVSKILSLTVLKHYETAPFIMEMPAYHFPSPANVFRRVVERIWMFLRKVLTIIVFVMIALFFLLNYPGVGPDEKMAFNRRVREAVASFSEQLGSDNDYRSILLKEDNMAELLNFNEAYKTAKRGISDDESLQQVNLKYLEKDPEYFKIAGGGSFKLPSDSIKGLQAYRKDYKTAHAHFIRDFSNLPYAERQTAFNTFYSSWKKANPLFFKIVRTGEITVKDNQITDLEAQAVSREIRSIDRTRKVLRKEYHDDTIEKSFLGYFGQSIELLTQYVGFNWKINVGLLSALAAKENTVATLGSIYQSADSARELGEKISEQEKGLTPLHAAAMIIFMALYPPCLATLITISAEAGFKWMLFATAYPTVLGFIFAFVIFTGGSLLGLSGLQAMLTLYLSLIIIMILAGLIKPKKKPRSEEQAP